MIRSIPLVAVAALGIALSAHAQQPADSADVLVFSGSFTAGTREFARVFLQKGQVYRAEINMGAVFFRIRSRHPGGDTPTIAQIRGGAGSGESVYEIYPFNDEEYEVLVGDYPEGETATLNIYRDVHASRRRQGIASAGGSHWYIGLELAYDHHGSYPISIYENNPDRSASDLEGCLTLRPSGGRFSACIIGITRHSGKRAVDVLWVYTEPRVAIIRGGGVTRPEVGVLLRGGFGSSQSTGNPPFIVDAGAKPAMIGFGGYIKIWPSGTTGRGLNAGLSAQHVFLSGVQGITPTFDQVGVNVGFAF